ncbi:MAG: beta-carotene 15,15'-dioxygenase, Brp/Blh family [Rhodothermaceae bacterium]|nr:beta-carotene 15,15'-dioxygenase, Brp/Blh family [Rhodothermaceae bacterium]
MTGRGRASGRPSIAWPRLGLAIAWGGVALSLLAAPWIQRAPSVVWLGPWLASIVVLGLPHGAVDPWVPFRMRGQSLTAGRLTVFCTLYLAVASLVMGLWWLAPVAAAIGFILLTWAHWGQGDVFVLRALGWDGHLGSRVHLALAGVVRGALPMLVPLAAQPEAYAEVLRGLVALFEPDQAQVVAAAASGAAGRVTVGLALLIGGYAVWSARSAQQRGAWRTFGLDLGETAALLVFFAVLPPLWSVGIYFCLWHALRHLARLEPAVAAGRPLRLGAMAVPATVGALALFVLLGWMLVREPGTSAWLAVYLVGIAALTVPHVLVVTWMDVRQGVWRPG